MKKITLLTLLTSAFTISLLSGCGNSNSTTYKIIIAGMTDSAERRKSIDFSDSYYQSELVLVCNSNDSSIDFNHIYNKEELSTLLNGKILISQTGTITDDIIKNVFVPEFNATRANSVDSFTQASIIVTQGQAFAFTAELPVAQSYVNGSNGSLKILRLENEILGKENLDQLSVSIGIKKGKQEFLTSLNEALSEISIDTRNDLMTQMVEFNAKNNEPNDNLRSPIKGSKGKIIVGLECNYPSFNWTETTQNNYTYKLNGKSKEFAEGYDVEIAWLIAQKLDMTLEFEKMEWDALLSWANL